MTTRPVSATPDLQSVGGLVGRAAGAAYWSLLLKLVFQLLALAAMLLLVRVLSREDFGAYSLIVATLPLLQLVGSFGLTNLLQRFLPEYYAAGTHGRAARLVTVVASARLLITVAILAVVVAFWAELAPLVKLDPYREPFLLFTIGIVAFQQWGLFKLALEARFRHDLTLALQVGGAVIRCAGYALAFGSEAPLLVVLAADCANFSFLALSHLWLYRRHRPAVEPASPDSAPGERRRLLRFGAFSHFNDAGAQLLDRGIDHYLVAIFLDLPAVAVYAFCDEVARKLGRLSPVSLFGDVVRPLVFARGAQLPQARLDAAVNLLNRANYAYFIPLFFMVALCGAELIEFAFGKYAEYHLVLLAALGFYVLNELAFPVGIVAQLRERVDVVLYSKVFGLYNLLAAMLLIPLLGVLGAVVATGTANLLKTAFIWWHVRREFSLWPSLRQNASCVLWWAIGTLVLVLFAELAGIPRLLAAMVGMPLLLVGYLYWVHAPNADEALVLAHLEQRHPAFRLLRPLLRIERGSA